MNEYGGCLPFEVRKNKLYWEKFSNNCVNVDSGRSALQYILEKKHIRRIWMPVYNCPLVSKRISFVRNIDIEYYNIGLDFYPQIDFKKDCKEGDAVLWVNYLGVMSEKLVDKIAEELVRHNLTCIIDNIPAYFSKPRMNAVNIYSCRKFIGVPDGGHVIGDCIESEIISSDSGADNYLYLLNATSEGSNKVYREYKLNEDRFENSYEVRGMSKLTNIILQGVDYEWIKKRRKDNFWFLHKKLTDVNCFPIVTDLEVPLYYPLLIEHEDLRTRLLEKSVFTPQLWKKVINEDCANEFERKIAKYLVPLPIDQRYELEDIERLAQIVLDEIKILERG